MFHSHVGRESSSLGLIGSFMVEPAGSKFLDPLTGKESKSGWEMMIANDKAGNTTQYDFNEQNQVFSLEGHEWPFKPEMTGADMLSSLQFGSSENLDVFIKQGAGGPLHIPGDYIWQNHRMPYMESGQWGYLRVLPAGDQRVLPLNADRKINTAKEAPEKGNVGSLSMRDK
ncbi:MAG: hypothetical protein HY202_09855 [Nitrospirae bacterium]|nr:hypothetical protein [Nitrospirota bacterium]